MIPRSTLMRVIEKMVAETGQRGIQKMSESVLGVPWKSVCDTVSDNFGKPDGSHRHPAQLAMDFMMLGSAIGYLFAKGDRQNDTSICGVTGTDSHDKSCRYLGNDVWDCGKLDNAN